MPCHVMPCHVMSCHVISHVYKPGLKFVAIGDWGDDAGAGVERQKEIAQTMDTWCGRNGCQFIVDTGDNFYPQGVTSVDDVRFDTSWKSVYNLPNIANKQWFISLGNNDHDDEASVPQDQREQYQVKENLRKRACWPGVVHGKIVTRPDPTRGSIRPVDNSVLAYYSILYIFQCMEMLCLLAELMIPRIQPCSVRFVGSRGFHPHPSGASRPPGFHDPLV